MILGLPKENILYMVNEETAKKANPSEFVANDLVILSPYYQCLL